MWTLYDNKERPYSWFKYRDIFNEEEKLKIEKIKAYQREQAQSGTIADDDSGEEKADDKIRRSKVSFIDITDDTVWLYRHLTEYINLINNSNYNFDLSGFHPLQYGIYQDVDKGFYDWHRDGTMQENRYNTVRKLSFSLLMSKSSDFEGGDLQFNHGLGETDSFNTRIETLELDQYDIVFFPSFMPHTVSPVTNGVRESIVGWVHGPVWR